MSLQVESTMSLQLESIMSLQVESTVSFQVESTMAFQMESTMSLPAESTISLPSETTISSPEKSECGSSLNESVFCLAHYHKSCFYCVVCNHSQWDCYTYWMIHRSENFCLKKFCTKSWGTHKLFSWDKFLLVYAWTVHRWCSKHIGAFLSAMSIESSYWGRSVTWTRGTQCTVPLVHVGPWFCSCFFAVAL